MKFPLVSPYGEPTESWWTDPQHFYQRARTELPRMRNSKYGVLLAPVYADMAPIPDKRLRRPPNEM